jgi:hypothetical protein
MHVKLFPNNASGGQGVKREAGKKKEVGKLGKRGELE